MELRHLRYFVMAAEEANIPHVRIAVLHCEMEKRFSLLSAHATDALRGTLGLAPDHGSSLRAESVIATYPFTYSAVINITLLCLWTG